MYNVMIVDDEHLIREGLRSLIDWEDSGFKVIDIARDGNEALAKYDQAMPDLMIVDIRMPGMDGLQLIEAVRNKNLNPHFLILSGYADFDYAKRAITSKVDGYILKPVDEDELIQYLELIRITLDKEKENEFLNDEDKRRRLEIYIKSLLEENNYTDDEIFEKANQFDLIWEKYRILLLSVQAKNEQGVNFIPNGKKRIFESIKEKKLGIVFFQDPYICILLNESMVNSKSLQQLYGEITATLGEFDLEVSASIGETVASIANINASYDTAVKLLQYKFTFENDRIIYATMITELKKRLSEKNNTDSFEINPFIDKLFYSLDISNNESISHILEQVGNEMFYHDMTEQMIKSNYVKIVMGVMEKLIQHNPHLKPLSEETAWVVDIYKQPNMVQLQKIIKYHFKEVIGRLGISVNSDTLVKKMINLIQRNYNENLKLESLAEVFNYNSAYLGKLFKNHTGEYFNTYLDKTRINQAKELLDSGLKVYQVAERVGYTNADYFHNKFKKYVGMSPTSYRKK